MTTPAMRVLRISHSAVVDAWRGRERQLRAQGVEVRLLSARVWDEGGRPVALEPRPDEEVRGLRTVGRHPAGFLYDPRPLWSALGERWDVLDIHEEPYALATAEILALRALRRIVTRRTAPPYVLYSAQNIAKRYPWPFRSWERRSLSGAAGISVCNDEAGRIAVAKGFTGRVAVIPLGIDPETFFPAPVRPSGDPVSDASRVVVGYAGRLAPHKGPQVLIDAVAPDERLALRIAGDGPSAVSLAERARPCAERVTFCGPLETADLADFYRSIDVLAVPSLRTPGWCEQFGRVAVEAMACGTPVVASSTGALPDVVGGAGVLVPPGDAVALHDALVQVGVDQELSDRLRARGAERAAGCTWRVVAERYKALYEDVAGRSASPAQTAGADAVTEPLEVVVVAYGSPDLVRSAIAPLAGVYRVTVVDNSSLPAVRAVADQAGAVYLDPGRNGGFAAGVNHALAHRIDPRSDVLLLNPDATIAAADVETLHRALRRGPDLASVGPDQVDGNGSTARVGWPFPSPAGAWLDAIGLGRRRSTVDFVIGSVLLLRAEAIEDVGGFDERFFLYSEETDWAYRAHRRGWHHAVVPGALAVHLGGATSSDDARRDTHFHASQERYLRKHYGAAGWSVARLAVIVGGAIRSALLVGDRRAAARRRTRLYLDGPVRVESRLTELAGRNPTPTPHGAAP